MARVVNPGGFGFDKGSGSTSIENTGGVRDLINTYQKAQKNFKDFQSGNFDFGQFNPFSKGATGGSAGVSSGGASPVIGAGGGAAAGGASSGAALGGGGTGVFAGGAGASSGAAAGAAGTGAGASGAGGGAGAASMWYLIALAIAASVNEVRDQKASKKMREDFAAGGKAQPGANIAASAPTAASLAGDK